MIYKYPLRSDETDENAKDKDDRIPYMLQTMLNRIIMPRNVISICKDCSGIPQPT